MKFLTKLLLLDMYTVKWKNVLVALLPMYPVLTYILFCCDQLTNLKKLDFNPLSISLECAAIGLVATLYTVPLTCGFIGMKITHMIHHGKKKSAFRIIFFHVVVVGAIYMIALNYSHSHKVAAGGVLGMTAIIGFGRALMAGKTYIYVLDRNRIREEKIIYLKLMREIRRKKRKKKILKERQKLSKMSVASFS